MLSEVCDYIGLEIKPTPRDTTQSTVAVNVDVNPDIQYLKAALRRCAYNWVLQVIPFDFTAQCISFFLLLSQ